MSPSQKIQVKPSTFSLVVVCYVMLTVYLTFFDRPVPFIITLFSILIAAITIPRLLWIKRQEIHIRSVMVLSIFVLAIFSMMGLTYSLKNHEKEGFGLLSHVYRTNTDRFPVYIRKIQPADDAEYPNFVNIRRTNRFPNLPKTLPFYVENHGFLRIPQQGLYRFRIDGVEDAHIFIDGNLLLKEDLVTLHAGLHPIRLIYWKTIRSMNFVPVWYRVKPDTEMTDKEPEHFTAIPVTCFFPTMEAFEKRIQLSIKHYLPIVILILWLPVMGYVLMKFARSPAFRKSYLHYAILSAILLAGVVLRWFLLNTTLQFPDADEATIAIMSLKILRGESFLMYYGTPYIGSFDSLMTACSFLIFGTNNLALKMYPYLVSLGGMLVVYRLGVELYSIQIGVLATLFAAIGTPFMLDWSMRLTGGHVPVLLFGGVILLFTYRIVYTGQKSINLYKIVGFLAGISFWIHTASTVYIITAVLFLILHDKRIFIKKTGALFSLYFILGALPLLIANWQVKLQTANFFLKEGLPFLHKILRSPDNLKNLQESLASVIGLSPSLGIDDVVLFKSIVLIMYGGAAIYLILVTDKSITRLFRLSVHGNDGTEMFVVLACVTLFLYLWSSFGYTPGTGRYFIPFFLFLPFMLARFVMWVRSRNFTIALCLVGSILYINLLGNFRLATASLEPSQKDLTHVIQFLDYHHIRYIIGDYWLVGRIVFESQEHILAKPSTPVTHLVYDTIIEEQNARDVAYIATNEDDITVDIRDTYLRAVIGDFLVYVHPDFEIRQ